MHDIPFQSFPKMPRLEQEIFEITEKIDGTNCLIFVSEDKSIIKAGSRNNWITLPDDHFGFGQWVKDHEEELRTLPPGYHHGEWWGNRIQRGYGLKHNVFSLFRDVKDKPSCVSVVPHLCSVPFRDLHYTIETLWREGISWAASQYVVFDRPEGLIAYGKLTGKRYKIYF
jgi:hypothetical protein